MSLLRTSASKSLEHSPPVRDQLGVHPVLHLVRVGQIVDVSVLHPLQGVVQSAKLTWKEFNYLVLIPQTNLYWEHDCEEARPNENRTWYWNSLKSIWGPVLTWLTNDDEGPDVVVVVLEPAVHQDQPQPQHHHQQAARHQEQDQLSEQQGMVMTLQPQTFLCIISFPESSGDVGPF